jgi:hypothetical protein
LRFCKLDGCRLHGIVLFKSKTPGPKRMQEILR